MVNGIDNNVLVMCDSASLFEDGDGDGAGTELELVYDTGYIAQRSHTTRLIKVLLTNRRKP